MRYACISITLEGQVNIGYNEDFNAYIEKKVPKR